MRTLRPLAVAISLSFTACAAPASNPPIGVSAGVPAIEPTAPSSAALEDEADDGGHGVGHVVLFYIPNRIFDLLDIVRARLRLGPGLAVGARATEFADVFVGSYATVWAGLPGPRRKPAINWPFGLETRTGAEVSVADASVEGGVNYGFLEVGLGGQLLLIGVDLGVDVWEAVDFVTGLVTIDIEKDDL